MGSIPRLSWLIRGITSGATPVPFSLETNYGNTCKLSISLFYVQDHGHYCANPNSHSTVEYNSSVIALEEGESGGYGSLQFLQPTYPLLLKRRSLGIL